MSVIDEVKQKTDIVEVIGQYTRLTKSGRTFRALCPFHSEKNPSFFVYPEQQSWHCFGACNTGGDAFSFVMKKEGIEFGEALRLLADRAGIVIPSRSGAPKKEDQRLHQINEAAAQYFHNLLLNSPAGEKARTYIAKRGILPKTITDFQLGFCLSSWEALKQYMLERGYTEDELITAGLIIQAESGKSHDRFRNQLMFPICDAKGKVTGFGARVLDDSLPKYINSPQTDIFNKSSILYGINLAQAAIRQQDLAVLVEGYMDTIMAHQNGFHNVVASMGTSVTEQQISTIKRLTRNVVLALDSDAAGEEAMLRCVDYENVLGAEVKVMTLPQGKDPDDILRQDTEIWQHLLSEALPVIDYTFTMVTAKLDLTTARDKSLAVDKLGPIIAKIEEPVRQAHYIQKLAQMVNVSEHTIETTLSRIKPYRGAITSKPAVVLSPKPSLSSRTEENCLALLLQYPELKIFGAGPLPEYFQSSENREVFIAWHKTNDISSIKEGLDSAIWEYIDYLMNKKLFTTRLEQKYADYTLRLRESYLRSLQTKITEILAIEAQSGGTAAELAKLQEQGIEVTIQLGEVFTQRAKGSALKGTGNEKS